jgi:hypothetical protein
MKRQHARPAIACKAPFLVGIDVGTQTQDAVVVDADATPCLPKALAFANMREGYAQLYTALGEATAQTAPAVATDGCEALTAQGHRMLVLNSWMSRRAGERRDGAPRPTPLMPARWPRASSGRRCHLRQGGAS